MSLISEITSWVVISTHPHKEHVALENLNRQGFQTYCPRIRRRVRHARQLRQVLRPLFPGYVFVRLNPQREQWRSIDATFGVRNLIRFGEKPGTIPSEFIVGLQATEEEGAVALPRARDSYLPGEKVRLREGPFDGLIATVMSANDDERIVVLMDLLKRSVRVSVSINELVPANPEPRLIRPELRKNILAHAPEIASA
jgi:transcriptional antiterminator RfaH